MDLVTAPVGKPNLDNFSEERYISIATYKTAFYSIYLPIVCAVLLSGLDSEKMLKDIEDVSIDIGLNHAFILIVTPFFKSQIP